MKIISWNVNGIRAAIKKGFYDFVDDENPDIICLQETKAHKDQVDLQLPDYPYQFWNSAIKKGYSGTAIFSKIPLPKTCKTALAANHPRQGTPFTGKLIKFIKILKQRRTNRKSRAMPQWIVVQ